MNNQTNLFRGPFLRADLPLGRRRSRRRNTYSPPIDLHCNIGGLAHNINDPLVFICLIILAWSGCIALGAASAPCAADSLLRHCPDGPRVLRTYEDLAPRASFTIVERNEFDVSQHIHKSVAVLLHVVFVAGATLRGKIHHVCRHCRALRP